jgi:hypothetical protein
MNIKAQPGFVVIKFDLKEIDKGAHQTLDSGIVITGALAAHMEDEEVTHLEHLIVGTSERSELTVGDMVITSKQPMVIEVKVGGETFGIMPESEAFASFTPEEK